MLPVRMTRRHATAALVAAAALLGGLLAGFAVAVSLEGAREWLPWLVFGAFATLGLAALALLRGVLLGAAGELRAVNAQLQDVNERLAGANQDLELRAAELARSNQELEQFASIASHDLQEPLRKVQTFGGQLAEREADRLSEQGRDHLRRMTAAAARMQVLIQDLLKFSRVATHGREFAPVDLNHVLREVLGDLEVAVNEAKASVRVDRLPPVVADCLQMRQLLQNLLSNALKFRRPDTPLQIRVSGRITDRWVELSVADNGIGFEPQYAARIFLVVERLHGMGAYPGTGIGLALCRRIVERHGGGISAEGRPGAGAVFTVRLPVRASESPSPSTAAPASRLDPASAARQEVTLARR